MEGLHEIEPNQEVNLENTHQEHLFEYHLAYAAWQQGVDISTSKLDEWTRDNFINNDEAELVRQYYQELQEIDDGEATA